MSVEIPPNIQTEIDEFLAPGKTGQIRLNVYQGKIVSADLQRHVKAEPEAMRENHQINLEIMLDNHQATP
jgi:polyhydroxyalkanoate synthesis regulator phasin